MEISGNAAQEMVNRLSKDDQFSDLIFVVAYENESLWDVAERMIAHQIDGMPVVRRMESGKLKVVGRVTKTNIAKAFVALGKQQ